MEVLEPDSSAAKLPMHKLAGFTSDGASVMISAKQGVLGKLRNAVNPKLFSSHCPPHRLVLAAKEGQKVIPDDIEKTLSDTLFFFKDSSVRRDEFRGLQELEFKVCKSLLNLIVHWCQLLFTIRCVGCHSLIVFREWFSFYHYWSNTLKNKQKIHKIGKLFVSNAEIYMFGYQCQHFISTYTS